MPQAGHILTDLGGILTWLSVMARSERRVFGKALHLHLMAASPGPSHGCVGVPRFAMSGWCNALKGSPERARSLPFLHRPHPISSILPHTTVSVSATVAAAASSSSTLSRQQQQQHHPAVRHGGDASEWCHCTNRISPPRKHAENKALLLRGSRNTFAWRDPLPMKMSNADIVLNSADRVVKCKCTYACMYPPSLLLASLFCAVIYLLIVKILPQLITTYRSHLLTWSVHLYDWMFFSAMDW